MDSSAPKDEDQDKTESKTQEVAKDNTLLNNEQTLMGYQQSVKVAPPNDLQVKMQSMENYEINSSYAKVDAKG